MPTCTLARTCPLTYVMYPVVISKIHRAGQMAPRELQRSSAPTSYNSRLPITLVPEDPTPSSGLCSHLHSWYMCRHVHTRTHACTHTGTGSQVTTRGPTPLSPLLQISLVEKYIEEQLLERIPGFNMAAFTTTLQ